MTVQVFSVVFSSMPKNRLTSQKPESLTWDSTVAPAAIATTTRTSWTSPRFAAAAGPAISPPVVVSATVADPCATRSRVAITKACRISEKPRSDSEELRAAPMPLQLAARRRTCRRRR